MRRMQVFAGLATLALAVSCCLTAARAVAQATPVYKNPKAPIEARIDDLLKRLTLDEKLELIGGTGFGTKPIPRLGIPAMGMCDGPVGVRGGGAGTTGPATVFPCGIAMAATWDPATVKRIGTAIGEELQNKGPGAQVILGPCVGIHRTPLGGRNGESFSEDPYLASRMAVAYIEGVQSTGAASCVKHYDANNQEWERGSINVRVDERALREIYLPAFRAAVEEAHVRCIMNAYNKVNGEHCSANQYLLTDVVRKDWGWDGCMMTDWGAAHSTLGCALAGTDLEMPTGAFMNPKRLKPLIEAGKVSQAVIDQKVRRILRTIIRVGLLDHTPHPDPSVVDSPAHRAIVRQAGAESIVLLKNEGGVLPLDMTKLHSIAVIGPNAAENRTSMGGSGYVTPATNVSALEAIRERAGNRVVVNYAKGSDMGDETLPAIPADVFTPAGGAAGVHGLKAEYFANQNLQGQPALVRTDATVDFHWTGLPAAKVPHDHFSVRWTGKLVPAISGEYTIGASSDDGSRVFLDGKQIIGNWSDHAMQSVTAHVRLQAGHQYDLRVEYYQNTGDAAMVLGWRAPNAAPGQDPLIAEAVAAARKSDVAVIFAGLSSQYEGEGRDRTNLDLPGTQNALIEAVAAANPKTIVVLTNGTPLMIGGWLPQVPAVLEAWYLGDQGGYSAADVLFGDVDPSGRLPDTIAVRRQDYCDFGHYPGSRGQVSYDEGIYVGYRWFDKKGIKPLFPFGYGLSYTTFEYSGLKISPASIPANGKATVSLTVRNTGKRAGADVVELYIHDPAPKIDKPVRELKRFAKVSLQPGESKTVSFTLDPRALSYCDVAGKQWRADAGRYEIEIGASSRDIKLRGNLDLAAEWTQAVPDMGNWKDEMPKLGRDLALGRPVTASSVEKKGTEPEGAVDDSLSTRWSSKFSDPQWIAVDLGKVMTIDKVGLNWETAYASAYTIEVSTDGANWHKVYSTQDGQGGEELDSFAPVDARYVRLTCLKRGTQYGDSLFDFAVYGPKAK